MFIEITRLSGKVLALDISRIDQLLTDDDGDTQITYLHLDGETEYICTRERLDSVRIRINELLRLQWQRD